MSALSVHSIRHNPIIPPIQPTIHPPGAISGTDSIMSITDSLLQNNYALQDASGVQPWGGAIHCARVTKYSLTPHLTLTRVTLTENNADGGLGG